MQLSFFKSLFGQKKFINGQYKASAPTAYTQDIEFEDLYDKYLKDHQIVNNKRDVALFSGCIYPNNAEREDINVKGVSFIVFDFDNKAFEQDSSVGQSLPEDHFDNLEGYEYCYYSTHSHTDQLAKWRLILPLSSAIKTEDWQQVWYGACALLGNDPNNDESSKSLSLTYFLPSTTKENESVAFSNYIKGKSITPEELLDLANGYMPAQEKNTTQKQNGETLGRNNYLKKIVAGKLKDNVPLGRLIQELVEMDTKEHTEPLFTDIKEGFTSDPFSGALKFFSNILHSMNKDFRNTGEIKQPVILNGHVIEMTEKEIPKETNIYSQLEPLPNACYNLPGVLQDIADYINDTARRKQPAFAIQAAISLVCTILGRKYMTETGLRTNLMLVSIGDTASGKEHGRKSIKKILAETRLDERFLGGEELKSAAGLMRAVADKPNVVFLLDELGLFLQSAKNPLSGSHKADVLTQLMKLSSSADSVINGAEYASKEQVVHVKYPCVNLYCTTTGKTFYDALSSENVVSGYLNRLLVCETPNPLGEKQKPSRRKVPESIKQWITDVSNPRQTGGNMVGIGHETPVEVLMDDEANKYFTAFEEKIELKFDKSHKNFDEDLAPLWGRCVEMVSKLALVAAVSEKTVHAEINVHHMKWAILYVEHCFNTMAVAVKERVADSPFQAMVKDTLRLFKGADRRGLTKSELSRRKPYSSFRTRDQKEILEVLSEQGYIQTVTDSTGGRGRESLVYSGFLV